MYVVIMQGPPGSGKSTLGAKIAVGLTCQICSTDDLHLEYPGARYVFKPERAGELHRSNQMRVLGFLKRGISVVVDNTNIRAWEARPYVEMARNFGAEVVFVRCNGRFANVHGVPEERVEAMRAAMEELSVERCLQAERPKGA